MTSPLHGGHAHSATSTRKPNRMTDLAWVIEWETS
jgi:hypothetical protein